MRVVHTHDPMVVARYVADRIMAKLEVGKKVLWFLPGGSSITAAAEASKIIRQKPHANLVATLSDERYGPVGHADSNWFQLEEAGFSLTEGESIPVLLGEDRAVTTAKWGETLKNKIAEADYILGFFGTGADGHIAGIFPFSPALTSNEITTSFQEPQYARITITPFVIDELDEVVAFSRGENKWPALKQLVTSEVSIEEQPTQLMKRVPESTLFTDMP